MFSEESLRELWGKEMQMYEDFGNQLKEEISMLMQEVEVVGEITSRVKETSSLIKKIFSKNKKYDELHDKVGLRIVVQFQENLSSLDRHITKHFDTRIVSRDDKATSLTEHEFGYQSIHYDIIDINRTIYCELQVRTICQHNWSMLSHTLAYKKDMNIPTSVKRQINALSALFEVADRQFQSIHDTINGLPDNHSISVLNWIENYFYKISNTSYDHNMTSKIIDTLDEIYDNENIFEKLTFFVDSNNVNLTRKIKDPSSGIFYSQPEIIIILERLQNKKILFKNKWQEIYPIELLESIANTWGTSTT